MGLPGGDGAQGARGFLEEHQISKPRTRRSFESALTVSCPDIASASYRFFCAVVVIISEGANLGFEFDTGKQLPVGDDQETSQSNQAILELFRETHAYFCGTKK